MHWTTGVPGFKLNTPMSIKIGIIPRESKRRTLGFAVCRRFWVVPMVLAAAALALAGEPGTDREVLGALAALKQAVVTKDRPALAKLLHPDLTYGHTDGHLETRDQVLDRVTDSKVSFAAIDVSDAVVKAYGQIALVTAKLAFHVNADGKQSVSTLSTLDVWIRGPEGWQLVGRQLTRPPK